MSPAGSGIEQFRRVRLAPYLTGPLALAALIGVFVLLSGGRTAHAAPALQVAALSPAWDEFHQLCEQGPSPGQGNSGSACRCWERNLEAEAIVPGYALIDLVNAQVGGPDGWMVRENLASSAVGAAMGGCGLYEKSGSV
jgi:hypothetical protein